MKTNRPMSKPRSRRRESAHTARNGADSRPRLPRQTRASSHLHAVLLCALATLRALLLLSTLIPPLSTCLAQGFSIDWHAIDGGGGASTGGVYAVTGTIGQPDAGGPMTNGPYSLTGGFWVLPTLVQTPGAPTLHITNAAPGWAMIWWTPPTPGFALQSTDSLAPTNWVNAPSGTNNPALVPATLPTRFYRLRKP